MRHFDVVIIGAGPAGSATALALRKFHPHLSVLLLEASDFQHVRLGETLSLDAVPLLQQLEVFDFFLEQNHAAIAARDRVNSAGTGTALQATMAGLEENGGWQVERCRFDSMLAGYAAASGAAFMRAMLNRVQLGANGLWQLSTQAGAVNHNLSASFVVDASGRSARFASEIGIAQMAHDTLVCLTRVVQLQQPRPRHADVRGVVETWEHGWWCSIPVGQNGLAVSIMTDADISKRLQLSELEQWKLHLAAAPMTRERIGNASMSNELHIRSAHTRNLASYAGSNWLAVGDAATSVDPLASQGILRAMRFGIKAGNAVGEQFGKRAAAELRDYSQLVRTEFEHSLMLRQEDYHLEQRWNGSPFWVRRHAMQAPSTLSSATGGRNTISLGGSRSSQA